MKLNSYTWRRATPKEMVERVREELANTPKRRFLKRHQLKRSLDMWQRAALDELRRSL